MPFVKAFCPYCNKEHRVEDIIYINPSREKRYCPNCLKEIKVKEAIELYKNHINKLLHDAYFTLDRVNEYYKAYLKFANILRYQPDCIQAREGRILSLVYLSTITHSQIKNAQTLFEIDGPKYCRSHKNNGYYNFLKTLNETINTYELTYYEHLTKDNQFYDGKCIRVFFPAVLDVIRFKESIINELDVLAKRKNPPEDIKEFRETIKSQISDYKYDLRHDTYPSPTGVVYNIVGFDEISGNILLSRAPNLLDPKIDHQRYGQLDFFKEEKKVPIRNVIFKGNAPLYHLVNMLKPLSILAYVLAGVFALAAVIILLINGVSNYIALGIGILAIIIAVLGVVATVYHHRRINFLYEDGLE